MAEERKIPVKPLAQNILMENREKLKVTGVLDVESFNDEGITVITELGRLLVYGKGLKIKNLNLQNSELNITGSIYCLEYDDKGKSKGQGLFSRMLK